MSEVNEFTLNKLRELTVLKPKRAERKEVKLEAQGSKNHAQSARGVSNELEVSRNHAQSAQEGRFNL